MLGTAIRFAKGQVKTLAPWAPLAGVAVVWVSYPAWTDNFKHRIMPGVFPAPAK